MIFYFLSNQEIAVSTSSELLSNLLAIFKFSTTKHNYPTSTGSVKVEDLSYYKLQVFIIGGFGVKNLGCTRLELKFHQSHVPSHDKGKMSKRK